jgi:hypothetical protein
VDAFFEARTPFKAIPRRFAFVENSSKSYKSDRIQKNTVTFGACGRIRTGDLLITSELLCQLSHTSINARDSIAHPGGGVNSFSPKPGGFFARLPRR